MNNSSALLSEVKADTNYQTVGVVANQPIFWESAKTRLTFPMSWLSGNYSDFDQWKANTRKTVRGLFLATPPDVAFNPEIIDTEDRGSYIAEKIVLNITADSRVLGYLLRPKGPGPFPAVLLLHDHGARFDIGKEKVIRPFHDSTERIAAAESYVGQLYGSRFIGDELASRGYVCFATDALNWGDRCGAGYEGQQSLASNLMNLGMSYAGLIAAEDMSTAQFITTIPGVDPQRIAAVGISMGAFRAWQVAAMSDDIQAAVCICRMASTRELMVPGNNLTKGQSAYTTTHPGLMNYLDTPDLASLACPKPMLFYNGENDRLFPVSTVQPAFDKLRKIWKSQNVSDRLITKYFPVKHEFSLAMQNEAFQWLDGVMQPLKSRIK